MVEIDSSHNSLLRPSPHLGEVGLTVDAGPEVDTLVAPISLEFAWGAVPVELSVAPIAWHHVTLARRPVHSSFVTDGRPLTPLPGVVSKIGTTSYGLRLYLDVDLRPFADAFSLAAPQTPYVTVAYAVRPIGSKSAQAALLDWCEGSTFILDSIEHRRSGGGRFPWRFDVINRWVCASLNSA